MSNENFYTIGEVSRLTGLSIHTLRYYDKQGLFPLIQRKGKNRIFSDEDLALIEIIECLKKTGMSLKDIRQYIEWSTQGEETIPQRFELIDHQRDLLQKKILEMNQMLTILDFKHSYYKSVLEDPSLLQLDFEEVLRAQRLEQSPFKHIDLDQLSGLKKKGS